MQLILVVELGHISLSHCDIYLAKLLGEENYPQGEGFSGQRPSNQERPFSRMTRPEMEDKHLVRMMLSGEEEAFEAFFDRYFPGLYRFALTRLGHDADSAEDVVQCTLTRAVDKLHTYRGEAALFTWLCTFCRHEISAHYRRKGRVSQVSLIEDAPEVRAALESLAGGIPDRPEEALRRKELSRLVQATLDALPGHYGDALEWKYIHGFTVKEIGERLKVGTKAAESLLTRAREAFRDGFTAISGGLAAEGLGPILE